MASAAPKKSSQEQLEELVGTLTTTRSSTEQKQAAQETSSEFAQIETNPFYEPFFAEDEDPNERMKAIGAILNAPSKEEKRAQMAKFNIMLAYLQSVREQMATDSIRLSDPKNFGVVRDTLDHMGGAMKDLFDNKLGPLTDILEVFETLGVSDDALNIYSEIEADRETQVKREEERRALEAAFEAKKTGVNSIDQQIAVERTKTGLFGGIKKDALQNIARLEVQLEAERTARDLAAQAVTNFTVATTNVSNSDDAVAIAKQKLKDFPATSSAEHEAAGNDLIQSAIKAIQQSKEKTGAIQVHLTNMEKQIEAQDDTATTLTFTYSLAEGGLKLAQDAVLKDLNTLETVPTDESPIDRLTRSNKQSDLKEFVSTLDKTKTKVNATVLDLATDTINIKNMKSTNTDNIGMIDEMHTRGVATIASSLATTVNALGATALSESSGIAASIMAEAQSRTDLIAKKQILKTAGNANTRNDALQKAVENLKAFKTIKDKAAEINRAGLERLNATNTEMEKLARAVSDSLTKDAGATADILNGVAATPVDGGTVPSATKVRKPFERS